MAEIPYYQGEEKPQYVRVGGGLVRIAIALAILAVILSILPGRAAVGLAIVVVLGALMVSPDILS